jgi:hypothetical protein
MPLREASLQTAKHPIKHPVDTGIPRSGVSSPEAFRGAGFKDLVRSLGLPQDKLSSSLLSLIRFFSLPLDPKLIQRLRQEVLSLKDLSLKVPQPFIDPTPVDRIWPGALAAAAATGKGVVLSTEALEKYAAAIAGEERDRGTSGEDTGGSWDGGSTGHNDGTEQDGDPDDGHRDAGYHDVQTGVSRHAEDGLTPGQLRDMVEKIEGRSPLLGILNKLPGKDGRRWINLPFSFSSGGVDYSVSLRILLADTNAIPWKAECFALDVVTDSRHWSFTLENAVKGGGISGEVPVFTRAVVGVYPPPEHPAALERNLRELLGTVAEEIILKDMTEGAFFEEAYR